MSREGVFSVLDYDVDSVEDNNSLNVLVSRIRRKCRDKCELDLPVTTHHNRRYTLEEDSVLVWFAGKNLAYFSRTHEGVMSLYVIISSSIRPIKVYFREYVL